MAAKQTVGYAVSDDIFVEDYSASIDTLIKDLTQYGDGVEDGIEVVEIRVIGTLKQTPVVFVPTPVKTSTKGKK